MNMRQYKFLKIGAIISFITWIAMGYLFGMIYTVFNIVGALIALASFGVIYLCDEKRRIKLIHKLCVSYVLNMISLQLLYSLENQYTWELFPFTIICLLCIGKKPGYNK